jgi:hypothetical protein
MNFFIFILSSESFTIILVLHIFRVQHFSYQNDSHFDMKISCAVIFHMNDGGSFHMKNTVYIYLISKSVIKNNKI